MYKHSSRLHLLQTLALYHILPHRPHLSILFILAHKSPTRRTWLRKEYVSTYYLRSPVLAMQTPTSFSHGVCVRTGGLQHQKKYLAPSRIRDSGYPGRPTCGARSIENRDPLLLCVCDEGCFGIISLCEEGVWGFRWWVRIQECAKDID